MHVIVLGTPEKKPTIGVVGLIGDVGVARFELTASAPKAGAIPGYATPRKVGKYTRKRGLMTFVKGRL